MKKSMNYITFVGKYEEEEYLLTSNGYVICDRCMQDVKKYSITYISEDIEVLFVERPIVKCFKEKISNSKKEAYLAFFAYKHRKTIE